MNFRTLIATAGLLVLAACETPGGTQSGYAPPENATQTVSVAGTSVIEASRTLRCTPSDDVQERAQQAQAEIDARQDALLAPDTLLRSGLTGNEFEAIWRDVGERTGCWFFGRTTRQLVDAEVPVNPGDLALHAYRPAGTMGVPTSSHAVCAVVEGQSMDDARENARRAAQSLLDEFDAIQTSFEKQVEAEGSAAFQNSDNLEQIAASRDRVKADFLCFTAYMTFPVVT